MKKLVYIITKLLGLASLVVFFAIIAIVLVLGTLEGDISRGIFEILGI